jgi:hypothetical protein
LLSLRALEELLSLLDRVELLSLRILLGVCNELEGCSDVREEALDMGVVDNTVVGVLGGGMCMLMGRGMEDDLVESAREGGNGGVGSATGVGILRAVTR